jgi:hypothetical protein
MDLLLLEKIISDVKSSYNRQIALVGNPWYDPQLTIHLKKDIELLERQKQELIEESLGHYSQTFDAF